MRDAHRMKEKFDVSLDNRQIVSLLIAGIVVLGAVFVLGVVVGKKLAGDAQTASAPDLLSALDANAQALQAVRKEPQLTFQDELTRKASAEPIAPVAPKPAPKAPVVAEKPVAKPAEPVKTAALAPTPDPDTGELPPEEPAEEPKAVVEAPKPVEKPAAEKPAEKPAALAVKPAVVSGKVEVAAVPTRTTQKEGGGLKEAIARAAQLPDPAVKGGAFTLQLSAFQDKQEAERFMGRLRDRGYAPYIVTAEVAGKGTWYRVRMGTFASKDAATRYLSDFKRETQLDAFVAGTN
ncbi:MULTISPECIES: SPOR domain-containing protein [unclassified Myxococcus]|jgi:cell division septation protein DedD|uniref:SPOR domain-containing protein n=1 Tax=Myxococcus TaxID=32 RepID=UPI001CC053DE|nr:MULTISPECIES: SPOR domain-containing protein [unclassified Myxococcus]MBZ4398057.1 SPOR domain-containing protein [Myxococcus sp. AS-1-15]MBZ4409259.1 SPOR domain-containing protein [Myxococcus sp. XM-1-1-1]BDT34965.1 SPOR domain-containing protein [Myxococcus sp. MH1]